MNSRIGGTSCSMMLLLAMFLLFGGAVHADTVDVSIASFAFTPDTLNITTGTTVRWTNQDAVAHTSTSDGGVWDSGSLSTGQSFSFTFNTPGDFTYHCTFHPLTMKDALIRVNAPSVPSMSPMSIALLIFLFMLITMWVIHSKRTTA